ncbi:hypothetical protein BMS3Bbin10_01426 [bacterium BMS3Bbin10]|nr:hypothetical protein BMS3Bbin10_01426 [bacterium BMS3Bbin10]
MTNKSRPRRFMIRALRPWWRLTRGLTIGAQGVVVDERSGVLLVRHRYRPGWFFPGGGVERFETIETALARELHEETGVALTAPAELHGIFSNGENFPGDHIAVFTVRAWEQAETPPPNMEIAEQGFFTLKDLPRGTDAGTRRRLAEIFDGADLSEMW